MAGQAGEVAALLREEQEAALPGLGFTTEPEILSALGLAVRRGLDVAALAADGSGKRILYGFAVAEQCERGGGLQALVLCPTHEAALRATEAVQAMGGAEGPRVRAFRLPAADGSLSPDSGTYEVLAGRPAALLPEVRSGRIPLEKLHLLVIDGVAALAALGQWSSVEAVLDTLAPGTQKVLTTDRVDEDFLDLLKRQAGRARRWPEELFQPDAAKGGGQGGAVTVSVALASSRGRRLDLLEELLRGGVKGPTLVACREGEDPSAIRAAIEARGLVPVDEDGGTGDDGLLVAGEEGDFEGRATLVLFGLPARSDRADALVRAAGRSAVIADTAHFRELELQAARRGWKLIPAVLPPPEEALEPIASYRQSIRRCVELAETSAEMLVLEPLFEEFGAPRVAAAVSALHRRTVSEPGSARPWADLEAALQPGAAPGGEPERGVRQAWARLFIGAGRRDDIRTADIVGAITGETGAVGGQIGKIEVRGSFSLVDVDAQIADRIIARLDGASIRGRQVRVRLDRES